MIASKSKINRISSL